MKNKVFSVFFLRYDWNAGTFSSCPKEWVRCIDESPLWWPVKIWVKRCSSSTFSEGFNFVLNMFLSLQFPPSQEKLAWLFAHLYQWNAWVFSSRALSQEALKYLVSLFWCQDGKYRFVFDFQKFYFDDKVRRSRFTFWNCSDGRKLWQSRRGPQFCVTYNCSNTNAQRKSSRLWNSILPASEFAG